MNGTESVKKVLSYINYYRNNKEILKLVAKLYGIVKPKYKIPGMRFYIYLYDAIKNYGRLFERENINLNDDLHNFTMNEIIFMKKVEITFWHDYNEFYQEARMLSTPDNYDKLVIACIYSENFDSLFKKYLSENRKSLVSNAEIGALYNLAEWAIKFNQFSNFKKIMDEIEHFSIKNAFREDRIKKLVIFSFLSENEVFPEYFREIYDWGSKYFDSVSFSLVSNALHKYLLSPNNDREFLHYLTTTYPSYFLANAGSIIIGHEFLEETYKGLDERTSDIFFQKFCIIAPLGNALGLNSYKRKLADTIESFSNTNTPFLAYRNQKFYIKCYEEIVRIKG